MELREKTWHYILLNKRESNGTKAVETSRPIEIFVKNAI